VSVFFTAEVLDGTLVEALDKCLNEDGRDVLLGEYLSYHGEWILLGRINRQSQLDGECNLDWGLFHSNTEESPSSDVSTATSLRRVLAWF